MMNAIYSYLLGRQNGWTPTLPRGHSSWRHSFLVQAQRPFMHLHSLQSCFWVSPSWHTGSSEKDLISFISTANPVLSTTFLSTVSQKPPFVITYLGIHVAWKPMQHSSKRQGMIFFWTHQWLSVDCSLSPFIYDIDPPWHGPSLTIAISWFFFLASQAATSKAHLLPWVTPFESHTGL